MAAYLIARITVDDMEQYQKYMAVSPGCIERYGGKTLRGLTVSLMGRTARGSGFCLRAACAYNVTG